MFSVLAERKTVKVTTPHWAVPLYKYHPVKILYGGRNSGKTWAVAQALVIEGAKRRLRIMCVRAVQKTIEHSTKYALEGMIRRCELNNVYNIFEYSIRGINGTKFMFQGLEGQRESIRGWEAIDIVWVDEAQAVSKETWEILLPTMRKPGVEVWITFNPKRSSDHAWKMAQNPEPDWFVRKVNFNDMPSAWRSPESEKIRLRTLREEPERYPHIYLGECDEAGEKPKVLPFKNVLLSKKLYKKEYAIGHPIAGMDLADSESGDWNCIVIRKGPCIEYIRRWRGLDPAQSAKRAHSICLNHGVQLLAYDAGGVGSVFKSAINSIAPSYLVRGVNFGSTVAGAELPYSGILTNRDYFARRNSQLAWALRMRLERLSRIHNGTPEERMIFGFGTNECLFMSPTAHQGLSWDMVSAEMSRPAYEQDISGRIKIDKDPDEEGSPDIFDAIGLAYMTDSMDGLMEDH